MLDAIYDLDLLLAIFAIDEGTRCDPNFLSIMSRCRLSMTPKARRVQASQSRSVCK